jgi:hypothetical protein
LITPFNWDDLSLAAAPVPPDDEDQELVAVQAGVKGILYA